MLVYLRPWSFCYDDGKVVGFMRAAYKIGEHFTKTYELKTIKNYDIIIMFDPVESKRWLIALPFGIYEEKTKTPESLMFKIDLILLENNLLKDIQYNIEEPFIFPMNDL